jgi:hypothetical protein
LPPHVFNAELPSELDDFEGEGEGFLDTGGFTDTGPEGVVQGDDIALADGICALRPTLTTYEYTTNTGLSDPGHAMRY